MTVPGAFGGSSSREGEPQAKCASDSPSVEGQGAGTRAPRPSTRHGVGQGSTAKARSAGVVASTKTIDCVRLAGKVPSAKSTRGLVVAPVLNTRTRVFAVANGRKPALPPVDAAPAATEALGVPATVPVGVVTKMSPPAVCALMKRSWFIPVWAAAKLSWKTVAVRVPPVLPKSTTVAR